MPQLSDFYSTAAQLFFALLGFWWVVVQFKQYRWSRDPARRRMSYVVSLHFLLPGVMCTISLLSADVQVIWNITFALAGLVGVIATSFVKVSSTTNKGAMLYTLFGQGLTMGLYLLITVIALFPGLLGAIGLNVRPLIVEGIMLTLIVVLAVTQAWFLFMEPDE